jgi:hypothetical protein
MAEGAKSGTLNCGNCNYLDDEVKKTLNCEGCDLSLNKDSGSASSSSDDNNVLAIAYLDEQNDNILVKNQYLKNKYRKDNVFIVFTKHGETEYQPVDSASIDVINKLIEEKKLIVIALKIQDDFVIMPNGNQTNIEVETKGGSRKPKRKTKKRKTKKRKTKRRTNKKRYRHL